MADVGQHAVEALEAQAAIIVIVAWAFFYSADRQRRISRGRAIMKYMHNILRSPGDINGGDTGDGSPGGDTADVAQAGTGAGQDEKTFTQEDVDHLLSVTKKKVSSSVLSGLLADVGVENVDALKSTLADWKTHQEGQKTELQKVQDELAAFQGIDEEAKNMKAQLQTAMDLLKANVDAQLATLKVPDHIASLIQKMDVTDALDYINKNAEALKPVPAPDIDGAKDGGSKAKQIDKDSLRSKYSI